MSIPLHVLLVEDTEADAELVLQSLRTGGYAPVFTRVQTAAAMTEALAAGDWQIVLSDYIMPGFDALGALEVLRRSGRNIPLIIVSGTIGEDTAVEAMKRGAVDYLMKDRLTRLGPAVAQALEQHWLRQDRAAAAKELGLFRTLMDQSTDALEVIDPPTGRFLDVNETECRELGYTRAELLTMGVPDIDPLIRQDDWEEIAATIREAGSLSGESRHQRKDGTSFPVEFNARWVRLDRDYIVTVVRDISVRKRLEDGLRASEERYRTTLESIMEGCQLIGFDWTYLYLNGAAAGHNRRPNAELLGRKMTDMWPGIEDTTVFALLRRSMEERKALHEEIEFIFADGSKGWFDVRSHPVPEGIFVLSIDISERMRAEAALRRSERSLSMAQRVAHIGNWDLELTNLADLADNPLRWSDELYRIFGHEPRGADISNHLFFRQVHPDDRQQVRAAMAETLRTGRPYDIEHRIVRPDGTERIIHEQADVVRDDQGRPLRMIGTSQDVTERKRAEIALQHREADFRLLFASNPMPMWVYAVDSLRFLAVNDAAVIHYGYTREEFLGMTIKDIRPPEDVPELLRSITRRPSGVDVSGHWRHRRKNGAVIFVHITSHAINFQDQPAELVLAQDVTAQHASEQALKASEEHFRQLIANGSDIIALVDQRGVIRFHSPSSERVLGHLPGEMTGRRIEDYVHPHDLPKVGEAMARALTGREKPIPVEYRCRHRDGSWRTLQSFGKVMTGQAGEKLVVVNSRDVTESRALEEQLRQSQKMEAIGQLSGGVAHDFNNLLTVIKGHIGLLRAKGQVSSGITGAIQQIDDAANRAANLTRQLLTFSRQQVMELTDQNLTGVVMTMAKMLRRLLSENIEMEVVAADAPLPIRADEGMVEQVLLNLVVNARDAMPRGGRLQISTISADFDDSATPPARPGAFAGLVVRDTGTGITPEIMSRIFEPFFTTKGIGKGTGLGLATVYGIMQQHQGWITVESAVGQGTTFRAYFPRQAINLPAAAAGAAVAALPGGHESILLAEDEATVRDIAQAALTGLGYRVFTATNGLAALRVWEAHRHEVDLLLTDLVMPEGMTGRDLAIRVREDSPRLPIVYMSGYSYEVAGEDYYLPKPFDLTGLARIIRGALDRGASRSPFAPKNAQ